MQRKTMYTTAIPNGKKVVGIDLPLVNACYNLGACTKKARQAGRGDLCLKKVWISMQGMTLCSQNLGLLYQEKGMHIEADQNSLFPRNWNQPNPQTNASKTGKKLVTV